MAALMRYTHIGEGTKRLEVDGCTLRPEHRPAPGTIASLPREVVLVPPEEWIGGLMLHVAFVTRFDDVLEVRA